MPIVKIEADRDVGLLPVQNNKTVSADLQAKILRVEPGQKGLFMWKHATPRVAFVGVLNMSSGAFAIRPLTVRVNLNGQADSLPYAGFTFHVNGRRIGPITHQGRVPGQALPQTSHAQLRDDAITTGGAFAEGGAQNFVGFSILKAAGTGVDPHLLRLRSGTLNSQFQQGGLSMPEDWAILIKTALEHHLPN